jgi:hypothetical protein
MIQRTTGDRSLADEASRPAAARAEPADDDALAKEVTLLELLDRVLDKGVVLSGDITLSVADVDLVYVGLRVLLSSVDAAARARAESVSGLPVRTQDNGFGGVSGS